MPQCGNCGAARAWGGKGGTDKNSKSFYLLSWKIFDFPTEQQLFLSSFYCYLKYDSYNDYVIDLDNVWKWLEFNKKCNAKSLLEKNFEININYKIFAPGGSGVKK